MTEAALSPTRRLDLSSALFAGAILTSAALVFFVQPMIAKMLLPRLGGSPAVWNTSMVFFQTALLLGYGYAHALQRLRDLRVQVVVHLALLGAASLVLPLAISAVAGDPRPEAPITWLLLALGLSVGAPFAALSATAPLLQSWFAKLQGEGEGKSPYALYVASNLGSMAALLLYPTLVEPFLDLDSQTTLWAQGYGLFALLVAALGLMIFTTATRRAQSEAAAPRVMEAAPSWHLRLSWIALAAIPSSLLLGTTTYISTDVAAAPFLWVAPLALYLLTFIIAFQDRPLISPFYALIGQAVVVPLCLLSMGVMLSWWIVLSLHAAGFFFSALVCHQAMAGRRPGPSRLTEFYLFVSLGGVIGGAATSFLAPVVFDKVLEYPLMLMLAGLARPWPKGKIRKADAVTLLVAICAAGLCMLFAEKGPSLKYWIGGSVVAVVAVSAVMRPKLLIIALALATLALQAFTLSRNNPEMHTSRSFFGVHRVMNSVSSTLGPLRLLAHGTTVHGAQPQLPALRCTPTTYYAPQGAIANSYDLMKASRPAMYTGVVGLGAGGTATYLRPGDRMRFFEIDPEVKRIASDRKYFTYLSDCAKGPVDVVLGDARLTLAHEAPASLDLLILDAFTSDAIPTHLLTVEAVSQYLGALKPDGVLVFHVSNRHLDLEGVVTAAAEQAGAHAYIQRFRPGRKYGEFQANASDVIAISRSPAALEPFAKSPRWEPAKGSDARAWTDDYTNIVGALIAGSRRPAGAQGQTGGRAG